MTDPETPIRRLARETLESLHSVQLRHEASSFYDDAMQTIEAALLQVQRETREACAQMAEMYLHSLPRGGEPYDRLDAQAAYSNSTVKRIAAALRAQAEGDRP